MIVWISELVHPIVQWCPSEFWAFSSAELCISHVNFILSQVSFMPMGWWLVAVGSTFLFASNGRKKELHWLSFKTEEKKFTKPSVNPPSHLIG